MEPARSLTPLSQVHMAALEAKGDLLPSRPLFFRLMPRRRFGCLTEPRLNFGNSGTISKIRIQRRFRPVLQPRAAMRRKSAFNAT